MASAVTLRTIGNWRSEIGVPLKSALAVSMDVTGRTGEQACRHALILMARSASAITPQSKKLRKVVKNPDQRWKTDRRRAPFGVMVYRKGKEVFNPIFRTGEYGNIRFFDRKSASWFEHFGADRNTWRKVASGEDPGNPDVVVPGINTDKRRKIGRRGLAKASWLWGLSSLGARSNAKHKAIGGVTTVDVFKGAKVAGYIMTDRLRYIRKILPTGWEGTVERKAGNKIMKQAEMKVEKDWTRAMGRQGKAASLQKMWHANRDIGTYFKTGLA